MNIKDILKNNGYEIIDEHVEMKYFELKFSKGRLEKMKADKAMYDFDLEGKFQVKISVDFDKNGDLSIILDSLGDEHFEEGDCFDVIGVSNKC